MNAAKNNPGRTAVTVRATAVSLILMASPICSAAEPVLWPSKGSFPAYPLEDSQRNVRVSASAVVGVDDNLFRVSDQAAAPVLGIDERGDRFIKGSLSLEADFDMSRQQFQFDATVDHYSFDRFSMLDAWLYSGAFNWRWVVGSDLKGDIGYTQSRRYPDFSELQFASEDLVNYQYAHVSADWQAMTRMAIRTLFEGSEYEHDDETRAVLNNRIGAGTLGVFYVGPSQGSIGVQHKVSEGDYPNREPVGLVSVDNRYRESESSLVAVMPFESKIGADLRIGFTQRRHEDIIERDFDGATGRAQLRYSPTPKILLDLAVYRELQVVEDLMASYAVVTGGSIGPAWAPTMKWVLQARYIYNRRVLEGNPGFILSDTPPREDRIRAARIVIGYQPNRHLEAALSFEQGERTSNVIDTDYDYNLALLQVTVSL